MDDVVAVVTDLFFQSRISTAARYSDRTVRFLTVNSETDGHALALVDLDADLDVLAVIRRLKAGSNAPIVAFGPHVDSEGRKAAREAGADRVLAKSRFVSELPLLLQKPAPSG
jgi:DNA-binding response OmpR family regulator